MNYLKENNLMKFILIILTLLFLCVSFSYGTGTITSGDKIYHFEPEEVPGTIDEWFAKLPLNQKVEIYIAYCGQVYEINTKEVNHD